MIVRTQAQLETLPDGTIISWLLVPGDETSRTVAILHLQVEVDPCGMFDDPPQRTAWLRMGGGTGGIEQLTYPVEVVKLGVITVQNLQAEQLRADYFTAMADEVDVPPPPAVLDVLHGGTWARETALKAAAEYWRGMTVTRGNREEARQVLQTAEAFEAWLDRPESTTPPTPEPLTALDGEGQLAPIFPHDEDDQAPERAEMVTWFEFLRDRGITATTMRHLIASVWAQVH